MKKILALLLGSMMAFASPVFALRGLQAGQQAQGKLTISTNEVLLDVVVRDKNNHLAKDLAAGDFEVFEDGVPQKIESFRLVSRETDSSTAAAKSGNSGKPSIENTASAEDDVFNTVSLFFDNLKPDSRPYACDAAKAYANENIKSKDYVGVFALNAALRPVLPFTRDPQLIKKAIEEVKSQAYVANQKPGAGLEMVNKAENIPDQQDPSNKKWQLFLAAVVEGFERLELQRRSSATIDSLLAIIDAQRRMPGRKALILFSDELTITAESAMQLPRVISAANKASVTIYSVDAAGLRGESVTAGSARSQRDLSERSMRRADSSGPILGEAISKDLEKNEYLLTNTSGRLSQLALWTGGYLISDTNDLASRLGRVDEELRTYYLLRYISTNPNSDGKFRQIEVKLKRPNLLVQSRKGYLATATGASPASFDTPVLAVLNNPAPPAAFPFKLMALSFPQASPIARVPVIARIPPDAVTYTEDKGANQWTTDFRVVALIKDQEGRAIKKLGQQFQLVIPSNKIEEARRTGLTFYSEAELPTGKFQIEAAAYDTPTGKASVNHTSLDVVAEGEGKLSLSSVIIVQSASQAPATRQAENLFVAGDLLLMPNVGEAIRKSASKQLPFFFTVRPAKGSAAPTAQLEIAQAGKSQAQLPLPLPAADATGRIQFASGLPTEGIPPGTYELRITVKDGQTTVTRSQTFIVEP